MSTRFRIVSYLDTSVGFVFPDEVWFRLERRRWWWPFWTYVTASSSRTRLREVLETLEKRAAFTPDVEYLP